MPGGNYEAGPFQEVAVLRNQVSSCSWARGHRVRQKSLSQIESRPFQVSAIAGIGEGAQFLDTRDAIAPVEGKLPSRILRGQKAGIGVRDGTQSGAVAG